MIRLCGLDPKTVEKVVLAHKRPAQFAAGYPYASFDVITPENMDEFLL